MHKHINAQKGFVNKAAGITNRVQGELMKLFNPK